MQPYCRLPELYFPPSPSLKAVSAPSSTALFNCPAAAPQSPSPQGPQPAKGHFIAAFQPAA